MRIKGISILVIFALALNMLSSCQKDKDKAIVLPAIDTSAIVQSVNIGMNSDTMVFVDLSSGITSSMPVKCFDLALEGAANGQYIYLNLGKYMFAYRTSCTNLLMADSSGLDWRTDASTLLGDSTAFGKNKTATGAVDSTVVILDRGKYLYTGSERFRKVQLTALDNYSYTIKYCKLNNSDYHEFVIPKNENYSLVYFSFDNGGALVTVAPPKDQWDMVFTRYINTYWDEPLQFRYYAVNGTLINVWNGAQSAMLKKDSLPDYIPYDAFQYSDINHYPFTSNADQMGFGWKYFDFNLNKYFITPNQYYIIKDHELKYYKLRYLDFYNAQGVRGYPTFQFQRIY